jgi:hypothetical protein
MAKPPPPPMPPAPLWLWIVTAAILLWAAFLLRPMLVQIERQSSWGFG